MVPPEASDGAALSTAIGRDAGERPGPRPGRGASGGGLGRDGESVGLAWADQGYTGDGPVTVAGLHVLLAGVDVAIVERRARQDLMGSRGGLHARTIEVLDEQVLA
jgi:hypothetical protein